MRRPARAASSPAFLALVLQFGAPGQVLAGKRLYVTPTGSKKGPCSETAPCRQIRRALSLAAAGDTIVVADGTYEGFDVVDRKATAEAPITIVAPNRGAEIRPGGGVTTTRPTSSSTTPRTSCSTASGRSTRPGSRCG
jgi:hypothetical protein